MPLCTKKRHKNYGGALKHISSLKESIGGTFGAYYCPACNAYHVTSNTSGKSKFVKFKG